MMKIAKHSLGCMGLLLPLAVCSTEYTETSYYAADPTNPAQYLLYTPHNDNYLYQHEAGNPHGGIEVTGSFINEPSFGNGQLCFSDVVSGTTNETVQNLSNAGCIDIYYYFVEGETSTDYYLINYRDGSVQFVQKGTAGDSDSFEYVEYSNMVFDPSAGTLAIADSSSSSSSESQSSSSSTIYIPGLTSSSLPSVYISSSSSSVSSTIESYSFETPATTSTDSDGSTIVTIDSTVEYVQTVDNENNTDYFLLEDDQLKQVDPETGTVLPAGPGGYPTISDGIVDLDFEATSVMFAN